MPSVRRARSRLRPPDGKVWNGLTAGFDASEFESRTGKHAAIWQHFIAWGGSYQYTLENSRRANSRLMLHLGTAQGQNLPERLSPGTIARGDGDGFLVGLTRDIAGVGAPVYLRLMGEMNNCNNAYAAYSCSGGTARSATTRAGAFKRAWKRTYLIMHGGDVATIDTRLRALGLPPVQAGARTLPEPQVAFMWAPMTGGAPNIARADGRGHTGRASNVGRLGRARASTRAFRTSPASTASTRTSRGRAQAVRDRRVGDLGRGRAGVREPAVRLDRGPPACQMVQYNQGAHAGRHLPPEPLPRLGARDPAAAQPPALLGSRPSSATRMRALSTHDIAAADVLNALDPEHPVTSACTYVTLAASGQ